MSLAFVNLVNTNAGNKSWMKCETVITRSGFAFLLIKSTMTNKHRTVFAKKEVKSPLEKKRC